MNPLTNKREILISGHRGTRVHAIENTRAAFDWAIQNHLDYVEFDVKNTKDNEIIVFHDVTINRLLNGTGSVENFTLEELRRFHYKDGQQIQTLAEFFEQIQKNVRPLLEIKSRDISASIMKIIHEFGYVSGELIIQSFFGEDILKCYQIDPQYELGLCMAYLGKSLLFQKKIAARKYMQAVDPYPIKWLNLDGPFIYNAFIEECIAHQKHIILGAQFIERYLKNLESWHVEMVNCNDAVKVRSLIVAKGYIVHQ